MDESGGIRRLPDGSIDLAFYTDRARQARSEALRAALQRLGAALRRRAPGDWTSGMREESRRPVPSR